MVFNPPVEERFAADDILITLGRREAIDELERMAKG